MLNIVYNIGYYCYIYRSAKLKDASKIDWEFEKSNKDMFMSEKNDGKAVVFPAIFTAKTAQDL